MLIDDSLDVTRSVDSPGVQLAVPELQIGLLGFGNTQNQRARGKFAVLLPNRVTDHDIGRTGQQTIRDQTRECQLSFRGAAWDAGFALHPDRQERVRARRPWPRFVVETHHPEVIKLEAGCLQDAQNLYGGLAAFGLEHRFSGNAP